MLQIEQIGKSFEEGRPILSGINLAVERGEIICLLGPSGCGKTTLLRIVAGLEQADNGHVLYDGTDLAQIPVHRRNFGLMFQDFALFPHRTVAENIAFGPRMAKWPATEIDARVAEMLSLIDLPQSYAGRSVFELSGGERQRVALARSLAPRPQLLMLDEPLGNLDRGLRGSLMTELRAILKGLGVTAIYVTHDQEEAYAVADRIVLMQEGRIVQVGKPQAVYLQPATPFVARFLGFYNQLPVRVEDAEGCWVTTAIRRLKLSRVPQDLSVEADCLLLIHPQAAALADGDLDAENVVAGVIERTSFRGDHYELFVAVTGDEGALTLHCELPTLSVQRLDGEATAIDLSQGAALNLALDTRLMSLIERPRE